MAWIGSAPNKATQRTDGTRTGSAVFAEQKTASVKIRADLGDIHAQDIVDMINECMRKDGGNYNADADLNGNKFVDVGDGTARTHFAAVGQIADGELISAGTSAGTDTITASLSPAITAYSANMLIVFRAGGTNTGAATLNINSVGAADLKKGPAGTTALAAGDITTGGIYFVIYNATTGDFELKNPKFPDGFATTDTPQFTGIEVGNASDTTITRASAGDIAVEGNIVYRDGGTTVPVDDGGSGRETSTAYAVICGGTTATAAHQSIASVGTAGQLLTSNGAGQLPTMQAAKVIPVAAGAISAAATIDIALSTADMYEIDLINFLPATDNVVLNMRFSQSAAFLSGASDYDWGIHTFDARFTDAADTKITLAAPAWGNAAGETGTITIRLFRPSAAAFRKAAIWQGYFHSTSAEPIATHGGGSLIANTDAIDGVQFLFSSGNIASGYYAVRSYSFT